MLSNETKAIGARPAQGAGLNLKLLIRQSWKITWDHWRLWALTLALLAAFVPAALLAAGFSSGVTLASDPMYPRLFPQLSVLTQVPAWGWFLLGTAALVAMVLATCLSWVIQAGAMRGVAAAAEGRSFSLHSALSLGRTRFTSILKLGLLFGILIAALSLLPHLLILLVPDPSFAALATGLLQTVVAPLNSMLAIAVLLILMSVALEETLAVQAVGRAWVVFRKGWTAFLVVMALSFLSAFAIALLLVPLVVTAGLAVVIENGWLLALLCASVTLPLVLFALIFTGVFTLVLYTMAYRSAARLLT
jgi:hypothetical protein